MNGLVTIVAAAIGAIPPTVAALLAWRRAHVVGRTVTSLRIEVNARLTELVRAAGEAGELRGRDAERADPRLEEEG